MLLGGLRSNKPLLLFIDLYNSTVTLGIPIT